MRNRLLALLFLTIATITINACSSASSDDGSTSSTDGLRKGDLYDPPPPKKPPELKYLGPIQVAQWLADDAQRLRRRLART